VPAIGGRSRSRLPAAAAAALGLRPAGDPYRTAFAAISLTAITKSSARAAGRAARAARRAVTRRTCRRSSALNLNPHSTGKPAAPRPVRPADSTTFPLPPGRPRNKPAGSPCSQGCAPKSLRGHFALVRSSLTTPRISPALRPRRKGCAEVGMGVAAAGGGAASGPVMAGDGFGTLAAAGVVAATRRSAAGLARVHRQNWPLIVKHRAALQRDIAPQTDQEPAQGTTIRVAAIAGSRRPTGRWRSGCAPVRGAASTAAAWSAFPARPLGRCKKME
jgi:hypothetical protein